MAIVIPILADTSGLVRKLTKGSTSLSKFGKTAAIAAGAAGVGALVATVKVGIGEFMEQEKVIAQTNAVLKSTNGVARVTAKEIGKLSESLMKKTGIDDEAIQSGQNLLLTFTKVRNEAGKGNDIFNQATVLMTDLSVAMGKDLSSSAMLVGKALNDPIKGVSALSRAGVQFTADQKEMIKGMVESGDVMGAQKMILKELETQFGGSAEAAGKTLGGQLNILKETFNNIAGDLVSRFMPTVARAAQSVVDFVRRFADAPTMKAKLDVVFESASSVFARFWTWWTQPSLETVRSPTSGVRVIFHPPGNRQVAQFVMDIDAALDKKMENLGERLGEKLARGIFTGSFDTAGDFDWAKYLNMMLNPTYWPQWAGEKVGLLIEGFVDGIEKYIQENPLQVSSKILDWLGLDGLKDKLRGFFDGAAKEAERTTRRLDVFSGIVTNGKKNKLTETVRVAVQSARRQLQGLGSSLLGLVSSGRSQMATTNSRNPGAILKDQRDLEDERYRLEEQRLRDARDAAEATDDDRLAYRELVLNREQQLRDRDLADQEATDKAKIDGLIGQFNRGEIAAAEFQTRLSEYLGTNFGSELGADFADAFRLEFDGIISLVEDIWNTVGARQGTRLQADKNTPVNDALRQSNEARFQSDLDQWRTLQDKRGDLADGDLSQAAFDKWFKAYKGPKRRPRRRDYGLALGGILNKQVFTAGEAGPEAVMPLSGRGGVMLRDALGLDGKQGSTYNITVNAGMGASGIDLGREIVQAIKQYERTNGNVFAGA